MTRLIDRRGAAAAQETDDVPPVAQQKPNEIRVRFLPTHWVAGVCPSAASSAREALLFLSCNKRDATISAGQRRRLIRALRGGTRHPRMGLIDCTRIPNIGYFESWRSVRRGARQGAAQPVLGHQASQDVPTCQAQRAPGPLMFPLFSASARAIVPAETSPGETGGDAAWRDAFSAAGLGVPGTTSRTSPRLSVTVVQRSFELANVRCVLVTHELLDEPQRDTRWRGRVGIGKYSWRGGLGRAGRDSAQQVQGDEQRMSSARSLETGEPERHLEMRRELWPETVRMIGRRQEPEVRDACEVLAEALVLTAIQKAQEVGLNAREARPPRRGRAFPSGLCPPGRRVRADQRSGSCGACPKSSALMMPSGSVAALRETNGIFAREDSACRARAVCSLPVPSLSPTISTCSFTRASAQSPAPVLPGARRFCRPTRTDPASPKGIAAGKLPGGASHAGLVRTQRRRSSAPTRKVSPGSHLRGGDRRRRCARELPVPAPPMFWISKEVQALRPHQQLAAKIARPNGAAAAPPARPPGSGRSLAFAPDSGLAGPRPTMHGFGARVDGTIATSPMRLESQRPHDDQRERLGRCPRDVCGRRFAPGIVVRSRHLDI